MQIFSLTKERTRNLQDHYWNLQKLNSVDELPKIGDSLRTATSTMPFAMDAYDTLHDNEMIDFTQPYWIIVQAEGMGRFQIMCEADWAIAVLIYD